MARSDPALAWREIQTDIKGSLQAVGQPGGALTPQQYLARAEQRSGEELDAALRERIYKLYRYLGHRPGRCCCAWRLLAFPFPVCDVWRRV